VVLHGSTSIRHLRLDCLDGDQRQKEAWDSPWFFSVGLPIVCVVSMLLAFFSPARPWRWGIIPTAGQFLCLLVSQGPGNLFPLGIVAFGVLSLPSIVTARIGSYFGRKRGSQANPLGLLEAT